ncbi:flavin reductase family protein [Rhodococcus sp. 077-4]|uniref:flavin reductase family protein n=1 Tax=Rhodococcus sp. 077-4 TaxID=2789271 RepID=UPI0039F58193
MTESATARPIHEVPTIDSVEMRNVLGHFATGVVAITATDTATGKQTGLAANSFTSVSLDPPLVAFCVAHTSSSWPTIKKSGRFVINILSEAQEYVGRQLAIKGGDKFAGLAWQPSPAGAPVLDDALAWIEAEIEAEHVAGDHVIVVSRVHHIYAADRDPLLFYRGKYGRLTAP